MLKTTNLTKKYDELQVLKGIDLHILENEIVSIVGASGAGKSTLLHILGTLDKPDNGQIFIKTTEVSLLSDNDLAKFRNKNIGFVFQFHNLLNEFTALENIILPAMLSSASEKEYLKRAEELLKLLGIFNRKEHKPHQLSGGEQQRVAVARALINSPAIIFADEPSGNLDSKNAEDLHSLFFKLREEFKQTFVIVTHNKDLANMADRTIEISDGLILTNESALPTTN